MVNATTKELQTKLIRRIYMSDDGREFVQYLQSELHETFSKILLSSKDERDELVGYGRCLSDLIKDFHKSVDKKINTSIFDI